MPLYEGRDLSQYLKKERIKEIWSGEKILKIFLQILSAIVYLHEKGIIYRDAKPQNCLLDKDFNVVIADFGISCSGSLEIMDRTIGKGTELYMAPEMEGDHYGCAVDIWAIGVTLYQLMYNALPFT